MGDGAQGDRRGEDVGMQGAFVGAGCCAQRYSRAQTFSGRCSPALTPPMALSSGCRGLTARRIVATVAPGWEKRGRFLVLRDSPAEGIVRAVGGSVWVGLLAFAESLPQRAGREIDMR